MKQERAARHLLPFQGTKDVGAGANRVELTAAQLELGDSAAGWCHGYESFGALRAGSLTRYVRLASGSVTASAVEARLMPREKRLVPADLFDLSWLRSTMEPPDCGAAGVVRVADLFCGCGGMSLGVKEACRALEKRAEFVFACDINPVALQVYRENLRPAVSDSSDIETLLDGEIGGALTRSERALRRKIGLVDFVIAGPPCQGHSDLNNHTRRSDPKNQLIMRAIRFVEVFDPKYLLIENVQGIRHDRMGILGAAKDVLSSLGYSFNDGLLRADMIGAAQARRRYFLFAGKTAVRTLASIPQLGPRDVRTLGWAIADLAGISSGSTFETAAEHSAENKRRINYLFDNDLYELPNSERPDCHRLGGHSYKSVYGRMYWDRPSPTITTGFGSVGQGRFVHPRFRRTLTPHEAARVQFFPDFFTFGEKGRRQYQELIGNAVPPKLAYSIALHQLR